MIYASDQCSFSLNMTSGIASIIDNTFMFKLKE